MGKPGFPKPWSPSGPFDVLTNTGPHDVMGQCLFRECTSTPQKMLVFPPDVEFVRT